MTSIQSEIIVLDSRLRTNFATTTAQNAVYSLLNVGGVLGTYEMLSYHSFNQIYNVEVDRNDTIYWDDGAPRTTVLNPGHYTPDELKTEIQTEMDANASALTFTVTFSSITGKYSWVGSGAFQFTWLTNVAQTDQARSLLGYSNVDTASNVNQTSDVLADLKLHSNIVIDIGGDNNHHVTLLGGAEHSLLVPLDSAFCTELHHVKEQSYQQTLLFSTSLSSLTVTLFDQSGVALVNAPDYELVIRKLF